MFVHATSEKSNSSSFINRKKEQPFFSPVMIQPKLTIGPVDDEYEREADAVADKVMRMSNTETLQTNASPVNIQRKCEHCEEEEKLQRKEDDEDKKTLQMKPFADLTVQRKCAECEAEEKNIHRKKSLKNSVPVVAPSVHQTVQSTGDSLDFKTRNFMESRFSYDFRNVRIHNDSLANQSSADIEAKAYTHGQHIVFAQGQYQPDTYAGKELLAHELTHVVQQNQNSHKSKIQRDQDDDANDDLTADEVDLKIEEDELTKEFPNIAKIGDADLLNSLAQFFVDYNIEITRRQQIGQLPFPYQSDRKDSDAEMNNLIIKLKNSIKAGNLDSINTIFNCCYLRLSLFKTENDLFEIAASFAVTEFLQLLFKGIFGFLERLEKAFDELQVILEELKEELRKADEGVKKSWLDAGISLLIDSTELFIEVSNPWVAAVVELGKFGAKQAAHHWLAPEMSKAFEIAETTTEAMDIAKGTAEAYAKKYGKEELEKLSQKIGKGTFGVGVVMDAGKIKAAYDERDKIGQTIFQMEEKFKGITMLFVRMGGEDGIKRIKFQLMATIARIKKVHESTGKLETDLRNGFKLFDSTCKNSYQNK
jgi:hypothetical protein